MPSIATQSAAFRRTANMAVGFPVLILCLLTAVLVWQVSVLTEASRMVAHSERVIAQADDCGFEILRMEVAKRGYLISGDPQFLVRLRNGRAQSQAALAELARLVRDNPHQNAGATAVADAFQALSRDTDGEIRDFQRSPTLMRLSFAHSASLADRDRIFSRLAQFVSAEQDLRTTRERRARIENDVVMGLAAALFITFVLAGLHSNRSMTAVAERYETALSEVQESAGLVSTTLLSIGDAVLVTDHDGRITRMNRPAEALTGWSSSDALGVPSSDVFQLFDATDHRRIDGPIQEVLSTAKAVSLSGDTVLRRRDGEEIAIDDSAAPIRSDNGDLLGVVLVFRDVTARKAAEAELAEVYAKEHNIAATLQRSLLQVPPEDAFPGLAISHAYESALDDADVGGDFLDMFQIDEHRVGLVVGDVSGKGLVAAARTAEVKFTLRAFLREAPSAGSALDRLNRIMSESAMSDSQAGFTCLSLAVYNTVSGIVEFAAAGAEPPLIVKKTGEAIEVDAAGPPLGIGAEVPYGVAEAILREGDLIVMVTDGITEARRDGEFFGYPGLSDAAHEVIGLPVKQGASHIVEAARKFADGPLRDDVCVLLARRTKLK